MSGHNSRQLNRTLSRTPSFYDMMKRNNPHNLGPTQLKCALVSACLSVPLFVIALTLVIFEHQACPDGASSNPDDNPLTDDNPNACHSWSQCIDHVTGECTTKDPAVGLLVFYYILIAFSVTICSLFLYCTKCLKAYNECAQFMGTDVFRYFVTVFFLFATVLTLLILGLVCSVEGARSCPPGAWKVSNHKRLYNPNQCEKCVQEGVAKLCVEDWDVDASLLEVGIVMIVLCFAIACGGCWYVIFRQKVAASLADEELMRKLSVSITERQAGATNMRVLETSQEAESPLSAPSPSGDGSPETMPMPMATKGGDIELAVIGQDEEQKEEMLVISDDKPEPSTEIVFEDQKEEEPAPNNADEEDVLEELSGDVIQEETPKGPEPAQTLTPASPSAAAAGHNLLKQRQKHSREPTPEPVPDPAEDDEPDVTDPPLELTAEDLESDHIAKMEALE